MIQSNLTEDLQFLRDLRRRGARFEFTSWGSLILDYHHAKVLPDEVRRVASIRHAVQEAGRASAWDSPSNEEAKNPFVDCGFSWLAEIWENGYRRGREEIDKEISDIRISE